MFWPHVAAPRPDSAQHRHPDYREGPDGEDWPACWGRCLAGQCILHTDYPGCCQVLHRMHPYATEGTAEGTGDMQDVTVQGSDNAQGAVAGSAGLYCW
jgi:hypothetical protein